MRSTSNTNAVYLNQCNAVQCIAIQNNAKNQMNLRNPGNSEKPGTGSPRKDPRKPALGVASAIGSLSQNKRGRGQAREEKSDEGEARIQAEVQAFHSVLGGSTWIYWDASRGSLGSMAGSRGTGRGEICCTTQPELRQHIVTVAQRRLARVHDTNRSRNWFPDWGPFGLTIQPRLHFARQPGDSREAP